MNLMIVEQGKTLACNIQVLSNNVACYSDVYTMKPLVAQR
jgi:hypothetical protein